MLYAMPVDSLHSRYSFCFSISRFFLIFRLTCIVVASTDANKDYIYIIFVTLNV